MTEGQQEPVAWRILCTTDGATGYLYTEALPFDPGYGVRVRREPEPLYAAPKPADSAPASSSVPAEVREALEAKDMLKLADDIDAVEIDDDVYTVGLTSLDKKLVVDALRHSSSATNATTISSSELQYLRESSVRSAQTCNSYLERAMKAEDKLSAYELARSSVPAGID